MVLGGGAAGRERGVRGFGGVDGGVRKPAGDASVKGREEGGQACASRKRRAESVSCAVCRSLFIVEDSEADEGSVGTGGDAKD